MRVHYRWQLVERSEPVKKIYIADLLNHRIRVVDQETGIIATVAGTGTPGYNGDDQPATDADLWRPNSVFVDSWMSR